MSDPSSQPTQPLTAERAERANERADALDMAAVAWKYSDESVSMKPDVPGWLRRRAAALRSGTADEQQSEVDRLRAENTAQAERLAAGEASDGYHTHNELYDYRMLYNAHAAHGWLAAGHRVVKSWTHSDGELCFGGGWFVVAAELPTGQVTNHYKAEHWGLFDVPEGTPPAYDGHTPADAADRLRAALGLDQDGRGQTNG